jgi:hypothetical protein
VFKPLPKSEEHDTEKRKAKKTHAQSQQNEEKETSDHIRLSTPVIKRKRKRNELTKSDEKSE